MKKLILFLVFLASMNYAQTVSFGDTTDLKTTNRTDVVLLQQYGGSTWDNTGGGFFYLADSSYDEGTYAFDSYYSGKQWIRVGTFGAIATSTITLENDETIANTTDGIIAIAGDVQIDGTASGLDMQGAYTSAAIDLTDVTLNYGGSSGPVMIRAGTYAAPVTSSDAGQSGMIRLYGANSATTDGESSGYYDRGIFVNNQITGTKGAFPISGLVEVRNVGTSAGPVAVQAGQFIAGLHTSTAKLDSTAGTTDGMFGVWAKVYSVTGSVADTTSRIAPIWIDSQLQGTVNGENYGIFATNGGLEVDAFIGFESQSGWGYLFYFDETAYDEPPISAITPATSGNDADGSLIINLNGTDYYIPYYGIGKD